MGVRLTRSESALFGLFAAASFILFAVDGVYAAGHNQVFLGADGSTARDQLQYLAWATDAAHHGLSANLYAFGLGGHVFLHPAWLLTGLLHVDAGLSYPLLLAVWKLVAIAATFAALRAYARSLLGAGDRRVPVAIGLGLFMASPTYLIVNGLHAGGAGLVNDIATLNVETFAVYWINGYFPIALAVAAMIVFLLGVDALFADDAGALGSRAAWLAGAAGAAASWLHPWQGLTLVVMVTGLVAWERPSRQRHARLLVPLALTLAPLVYYALLPAFDSGWSQSENSTATGFSFGSLVLGLLPIVVLMLPGYAGPATLARERLLRLWLPAILVVYVITPTDKQHAVGGISVPAALLVTRGWPWLRERTAGLRRVGPRGIAAVATGLLVVAAPVALGRRVSSFRSGQQGVALISRSSARGLDLIARMAPGGVLTTGRLGAWVPAITDDPTWVGHPVWTPSFYHRSALVANLFGAADDRHQRYVRFVVHAIGPTYVFEPCGFGGRLGPALGPAGFTSVRVGCATLLYRRSQGPRSG